MMTEDWNKSSYSNGNGGHCLEARRDQEAVLVRDTQNRNLGHLGYAPQEWTALLNTIITR